MWRKLLRALGCLFYLGLLLAVFASVSYVAFSQFVRRGVTPTPELFGLGEEEARALLADQGLRMEWSDEGDRFDDEVPAGHVLQQRPRAGALVKRGRAVSVLLSRGPQRIEIPDVEGQALQAAQVTLAGAGLKTGRTLGVYSDLGAPGTVVAQHPAGGERVEREGKVDLFLALENTAETYVMPDLIELPYEQVRRFFESQGYRLGRVSYDETYKDITSIAPGTVLRQFPLPGHPLQRGDVISLVVVTPEPPPEPADDATAGEAPDGTSEENSTR